LKKDLIIGMGLVVVVRVVISPLSIMKPRGLRGALHESPKVDNVMSVMAIGGGF